MFIYDDNSESGMLKSKMSHFGRYSRSWVLISKIAQLGQNSENLGVKFELLDLEFKFQYLGVQVKKEKFRAKT